jgi:hypothetical protein
MTADTLELFQQARKGPLVFVTNRYNLIHVLTSGLIGPVESYSKHYGDLLDLAPGRVPVLRGPVHPSIQSLVSREDEHGVPVALELRPEFFSEQAMRALNANGGDCQGRIGAEDCAAWAPRVAIPVAAVRRICFRSASELEEFLAREYENLATEATQAAVVAPELFTGGALDTSKLVPWLQGLKESPKPEREAFVHRDRVSGGLALSVAALPLAPEAAGAVAALLTARVSGADMPEKAAFKEFPWLTEIAVRGKAGKPDIERRFFSAAVQILSRVDRTSQWRPLEVLERIETLLQKTKSAKKEADKVATTFKAAREVLRNERELQPFKAVPGGVSARALLLALATPDPKKLLSTGFKERAGAPSVLITAAILSGVMNGLASLPASLRSQELSLILSEADALDLSDEGDRAIQRPGPPPSFLVKESTAGGVPGAGALVMGGKVLARWEVAEEPLAVVLERTDLSAGPITEALLAWAREQGWGDCVETEILTESSQATTVAKRGGGLALKVAGFVTVTARLNRELLLGRMRGAVLPHELGTRLRDLATGAQVDAKSSLSEGKTMKG